MKMFEMNLYRKKNISVQNLECSEIVHCRKYLFVNNNEIIILYKNFRIYESCF